MRTNFLLSLPALALLGWPIAAAADMPTGTLDLAFDADDKVCDFSSFGGCDTIEGVTGCLTLNLEPNGRGKYWGTSEFELSGDLLVTVGGDDVVIDLDGSAPIPGEASGNARGRDLGRRGNPEDKASIRSKHEGPIQATVFGQVEDLDAKVTLSCRGEVDNNCNAAFLCRGRLGLQAFVEGARRRASEPFAAFLTGPLDMTDLSVSVGIDPIDDKKFGGTATDSLGYMYDVVGRYNERKDTSTVRLKGMRGTDSNGASIRIKELISNGLNDGNGEARYRVQGYAGSASVSTD